MLSVSQWPALWCHVGLKCISIWIEVNRGITRYQKFTINPIKTAPEPGHKSPSRVGCRFLELKSSPKHISAAAWWGCRTQQPSSVTLLLLLWISNTEIQSSEQSPTKMWTSPCPHTWNAAHRLQAGPWGKREESPLCEKHLIQHNELQEDSFTE